MIVESLHNPKLNPGRIANTIQMCLTLTTRPAQSSTTPCLQYEELTPWINLLAQQRYPVLYNSNTIETIVLEQQEYEFYFNWLGHLNVKRIDHQGHEDWTFVVRKIVDYSWTAEIQRYQDLVDKIELDGFVFLKDDQGDYRYIELKPRGVPGSQI